MLYCFFFLIRACALNDLLCYQQIKFELELLNAFESQLP